MTKRDNLTRRLHVCWRSVFETLMDQVLDPRLMYTMTALRFSQDGNEALFSVQDIAFNPERGCSMAYGKYKCKDHRGW